MATVNTEHRGDVCVLRCADDGDRAFGAALDDAVLRCERRGGLAIVLDLGELTLDGAAVAALERARITVQRRGEGLVFAAEAPAVRDRLAAAGLVRSRSAAPRPALDDAGGPLVEDELLWEHEFAFPAAVEQLPAARRRIVALAQLAGLRDTELFELGVAGAEALANAVVHGSPHGRDDEVSVRFLRFEREVAVEIADTGRGIAAAPVCLPPSSAVSGRGIHFMRSLSDRMSFVCDARGTRVLLLKRLD